MASYPPPPPPGYDPQAQGQAQRRLQRDWARAQFRAQRDALRVQHAQMRYRMRGLRRGSVLGPILLIAVGVVFLLLETGRIDPQRFWQWYGARWPLLLIVAGVVLLAEWGFDQVHLRALRGPPYRRTVGGAVTMFLILAVAGVFAGRGYIVHRPQDTLVFHGFQLGPDSLDELFGDKHESDQTMDVAFPLGGSIAVVNPRGNVTVKGTSGDGRVHIAVHKEVYAQTDSEAKDKETQLGPVVNVTSYGPAMSVNIAALDGARADLVITAPAAAATSVTADRGDIYVASIKAQVAATANHGDIDLSAITGPAIAHSNSNGSSIAAHSMGGGIAIEGHAQDVTVSDIVGPVAISGEIFGTTHLDRIDGPVHLHTSRIDFQVARLDGEFESVPNTDLTVDQAVGPFVLHTSNRNINLDRIAGDIAVSDHNGRIKLTAAPPLGTITIEDRNGMVNLVLPKGSGFSVEANTANAQIDSSFPLSISGGWYHSSLNGTVGTGGPLVSVTTTNGDISLRQGTVQPLPPDPPAAARLTLAPGAPSHAARIGTGTGKGKGKGAPGP